ncbi:MAG: C39 family peptidase [Pseudomonadota bacterium]
MVTGTGFVRIPIDNIVERRFGTIIRQQYDFSCGSAAVATLLSYHYDRPTSEQDAFTAMWARGDQQRISQFGFSLAEMKIFLEALGYRADGFKLTLDRVAEVGVPGIALINLNGYKHFVVVKGVTDRVVLYGDPAAGIKVKSRKEFEELWEDGIFLLIRSNIEEGKNNFNKTTDWKLAPLGNTAQANRDVFGNDLVGEVLENDRTPFSGSITRSFSVVNILPSF